MDLLQFSKVSWRCVNTFCEDVFSKVADLGLNGSEARTFATPFDASQPSAAEVNCVFQIFKLHSKADANKFRTGARRKHPLFVLIYIESGRLKALKARIEQKIKMIVSRPQMAWRHNYLHTPIHHFKTSSYDSTVFALENLLYFIKEGSVTTELLLNQSPVYTFALFIAVYSWFNKKSWLSLSGSVRQYCDPHPERDRLPWKVWQLCGPAVKDWTGICLQVKVRRPGFMQKYFTIFAMWSFHFGLSGLHHGKTYSQALWTNRSR